MKPNRYMFNTAAAGALCLMAIGAQAQSGNLVLNPSFEASGGSLNNWNVANNSGFLTIDDGRIMSAVPQDGSYFAVFAGPTTGPSDSIDQSIATTPGHFYEVNYWVNDKYGSSVFSVNWGGSSLSQLTTTFNSSHALNGWVDFDFIVVAGSASTDLSFSGASDLALGLDNVSVTAVPEPMTYGLAGGLLGVAGFFFRGRRQAIN